MILGKFWDRELVEAVLAYFKAGNFRPAGCVLVNEQLCQGKDSLLQVEKFMQPEVIEAQYKRMVVPELTAICLTGA